MAAERKPGRGRAKPKGPVAKPPATPETPLQRVGRRPSPPGLLLVIGASWIAVGLIIFSRVHTGWRLIPAIVAMGIGLYFLRGAAATVVRRDKLRPKD